MGQVIVYFYTVLGLGTQGLDNNWLFYIPVMYASNFL